MVSGVEEKLNHLVDPYLRIFLDPLPAVPEKLRACVDFAVPYSTLE
jgi:hypothetical protein